MIPVVHLLRKRRKESAQKSVNRSPFAQNPKVGLFAAPPMGLPFACTKCDVAISVKDTRTTFCIAMEFLVNAAHCDLFFPISECGSVKSLSCRVKGRRVAGNVCRVSSSNGGALVPPTDSERFLNATDDDDGEDDDDVKSHKRRAEGANKKQQKKKPIDMNDSGSSSDSSEEQVRPQGDAPPDSKLAQERRRALQNAKGLTGKAREPTVYTFHVARVSEVLKGSSGLSVGEKILVEFEVITENISKDEATYSVPFPLSVVPRPPDSMRYGIEMKSPIRRIISPNRTHPIFPFIKDNKAELSLDITKENQIRLGDYMFIIMIELGEPIVPECADPVAILILVSAIGMLVFYMLTKDIDE